MTSHNRQVVKRLIEMI